MTRPPRGTRTLAILVLCTVALLAGVACDNGGDGGDSSSPGSGFEGAAGVEPTEATTPLASESGSATPVATATDTISLDACALVSQDEAAAALGQPVTEGEPSLVGEIATCTWTPESGSTFGSAQVAYLTRSVSASEFPAAISEATEADLDPIAQIGDAAFWDGDQAMVLVGGVALSAIVIPAENGETAADREASISLARLAAERAR